MKSGYEDVAKAFKITENSSTIMSVENMPNLKELYLSKKYSVDDIFRLRHLNNAKLFRKWINDFNTDFDSKELTEAYIYEATNSKTFFETTKGKLLKQVGVFTASNLAGVIIGGLAGIGVSLPISILADQAIDSIIKNKNPKIYLENLKNDF